MKVIVTVESSTRNGTDDPKYEVPFRYDENRSHWIAASDSIRIADEAIIGIHAEIDGHLKHLNLYFLHRSAQIATMICGVSGREALSFRFSPTHSVTALVEA